MDATTVAIDPNVPRSLTAILLTLPLPRCQSVDTLL